MKDLLHHPWNVSPRQAVRIQEDLRQKVHLGETKGSLKAIAAADISYSRTDERMYAAFLLFSYPDLTLLENASAKGRISFPYIPGLLTFREAPMLMKAFSRLKGRPDLLLFDGQGIAHPRYMGLAAHLGLLLGCPAIGCAKSRLWGVYEEPALAGGSMAPLRHEGRTVGLVVRTRTGVKPVFVSPGYKIGIETSGQVVLSLCRGYRIPEPLRQAHIFVNRLRGMAKELRGVKSGI